MAIFKTVKQLVKIRSNKNIYTNAMAKSRCSQKQTANRMVVMNIQRMFSPTFASRLICFNRDVSFPF